MARCEYCAPHMYLTQKLQRCLPAQVLKSVNISYPPFHPAPAFLLWLSFYPSSHLPRFSFPVYDLVLGLRTPRGEELNPRSQPGPHGGQAGVWISAGGFTKPDCGATSAGGPLASSSRPLLAEGEQAPHSFCPQDGQKDPGSLYHPRQVTELRFPQVTARHFLAPWWVY